MLCCYVSLNSHCITIFKLPSCVNASSKATIFGCLKASKILTSCSVVSRSFLFNLLMSMSLITCSAPDDLQLTNMAVPASKVG
jgi:hypothetical protein